VATTNTHKADEIRAILADVGIEVLTPTDLPEVVEDGATFRDNALLKARSAARHLNAAALADDSGLCVDVLGGEPGVRSARYAGPEATDGANNARLVERLVALGAETPQAAFVCHVVLVDADGSILAEAERRVEGHLRWPALGAGGFGYDPLFFHPPSGCRLSELAPEAKNAVSHRGRALRALAAALGEAGARPEREKPRPHAE
jgi:XTP/dITP diphosphohydrolase